MGLKTGRHNVKQEKSIAIRNNRTYQTAKVGNLKWYITWTIVKHMYIMGEKFMTLSLKMGRWIRWVW